MLVSELIDSAARKINAVASGEAMTDDEQQDFLAGLQSMLRSWSAEKINVFASVSETFTLTPPTFLYTWGSGGTISTARPNQILGASIDSDGASFLDCRIDSGQDFNARFTQPDNNGKINAKITSGLDTFEI